MTQPSRRRMALHEVLLRAATAALVLVAIVSFGTSIVTAVRGW